VSEAGQLVDALGPALTADDPILRALLTVIGDELDLVADVVRDRPGYPGWSLIGDLTRTRSVAWLLQWTGVRYRDDLTLEQNRARGSSRGEARRTTPDYITAVTREFLSGNRHVELTERLGGNARAIKVRVYAAELTASQASLTDALRRAMPWTFKLTLEVAAGWTYDQMAAQEATFNALKADFATFDAVSYHLLS
jgi:hypothetical protein